MLFLNKLHEFNCFIFSYLQNLHQVTTLGKPCNIYVTQIIKFLFIDKKTKINSIPYIFMVSLFGKHIFL